MIWLSQTGDWAQYSVCDFSPGSQLIVGVHAFIQSFIHSFIHSFVDFIFRAAKNISTPGEHNAAILVCLLDMRKKNFNIVFGAILLACYVEQQLGRDMVNFYEARYARFPFQLQIRMASYQKLNVQQSISLYRFSSSSRTHLATDPGYQPGQGPTRYCFKPCSLLIDNYLGATGSNAKRAI